MKISPTLASPFISEATMAENNIDEGNSLLPSGASVKYSSAETSRLFKISLQNRVLCRAWIINYSIMDVLFGFARLEPKRRIEKYLQRSSEHTVGGGALEERELNQVQLETSSDNFHAIVIAIRAFLCFNLSPLGVFLNSSSLLSSLSQCFPYLHLSTSAGFVLISFSPYRLLISSLIFTPPLRQSHLFFIFSVDSECTCNVWVCGRAFQVRRFGPFSRIST